MSGDVVGSGLDTVVDGVIGSSLVLFDCVFEVGEISCNAISALVVRVILLVDAHGQRLVFLKL